MRKSLLLTALAAIAMTASAQDLEINNELQVTKTNCTATDATFSANADLRLADVDLANPVGTYICKTTSTYNENCSHVITIAQTDGAYTVTGLMYGSTLALNATYSNGTLTVPAGQVSYSTTTYGDATMYVMVDASHYNSSIDPTFTLDESGKFTLSNGVGLIQMLSGTYDGYSLNDTYVGGYDFIPVNGTITNARVNSSWVASDTTTFETAVEYSGGSGVIRGIEGFGWVNFTYDDTGAVSVAQDSVYRYSSTYTLAVMTKAGTTSSGTFGIYSGTGPDGTVDFSAGTITLNPWCLTMTNTSTSGTSILNGRKSGSVITFPSTDPSAINDVAVESTTASKARKYISDGQFIIEKDGVKYNLAGQVIE